MASATTQHASMTALQVALDARPGLDGVPVRSAPSLRADASTREAVELWDTEADQDWRTLGNRRKEETYRIHGGLYVLKAGNTEAVVTATRARAVALLDEILAALASDPTIGGTVRVARLARNRIDQDFTDTGRWCLIEFWIECEAHLNVS